jgi:CRP-like cAMP-binding protein
MARMVAVYETLGTPASVRQVYAAGDHLFYQGDAERGIHKIISGTVTVYRVTADGHRQIEAFSGPGDYVSLCLCSVSPTSAEALSRVETEYVGRTAFERKILENSTFRQEVFLEIDKTAADARRQATLLACRCAKERVADFVLFLDSHFEPRTDGYSPIHMSRCDMADHLGLTLETVSRMLNSFKQSGIIDMPRPDRFRILNRKYLQRLAGQNDQDDRNSSGIAV